MSSARSGRGSLQPGVHLVLQHEAEVVHVVGEALLHEPLADQVHRHACFLDQLYVVRLGAFAAGLEEHCGTRGRLEHSLRRRVAREHGADFRGHALAFFGHVLVARLRGRIRRGQAHAVDRC